MSGSSLIRSASGFSDARSRQPQRRTAAAREKREAEIQLELFDEPVEIKTIADRPHDYRIVKNAKERAELISKLKQQKAFCFDTETTGP